jgi:hypothetical protein
MPEVDDWNAKTIAEFRANEGRVGGHSEGAPIVLLHHRRPRDRARVRQPDDVPPNNRDEDTIYVFASKAGAPSNPDWYHNFIATG